MLRQRDEEAAQEGMFCTVGSRQAPGETRNGADPAVGRAGTAVEDGESLQERGRAGEDKCQSEPGGREGSCRGAVKSLDLAGPKQGDAQKQGERSTAGRVSNIPEQSISHTVLISFVL